MYIVAHLFQSIKLLKCFSELVHKIIGIGIEVEVAIYSMYRSSLIEIGIITHVYLDWMWRFILCTIQVSLTLELPRTMI